MKKGFTLVELIAVLALISIVVLVGVPSVINVLDKSKTKTFVMEAESLMDAALMAYDESVNFGVTPKTCYTLADLANYTNKDFNSEAVGSVSIDKTNKEYLIWYYDGSRYVEGAEFGLVGEVGNEVTKGNPASTSTYNTCGGGVVEYTLTINVNGGTYSGDTTITLSPGETYTLPMVTKANHVVTNWTLPNGTIINGNTFTMGRRDTTITANWGIAKHTLTVVTNGGIWNGTTPQTKNAADPVTLNVPTKAYHIFQGWRRSDNNGLITTTSFAMPDNDLTLTAEWEAVAHTLTILTDGGLWNGTTPQTINDGVLVTINEPTKANYVFAGWKRSDNEEVVISFNMPTANLTITAEWVIEVTDFAYIAPTITEPNPYYEWIVPADGWYQVEALGAGGGNGTYPSKGGYTSGKIELNKGDKYYIYVAGKGITATTSDGTTGGGYNGGGNAGYYAGSWNAYTDGGGGATDIRYFGSTIPTTSNLEWDNDLGLKSRIMVAGGGAGRFYNAGGLIAYGYVSSYPGATQTTGYLFGKGQSNSTAFGGGGGYYGGFTNNNGSYGAGGSSFISGYAGVNAIKNDGTHSDNTRHYSGKYFIDGEMQSGVNEGNGKARITYLGPIEPIRINPKLNNVRYIKSCATESTCGTACYMHWSEFQALKDGVNLAKGLAVEGTFNTSNQSSTVITDGIIGETTAYHAGSLATTGDRCIIVDLGDRYNLDELAVWHYWGENWIYKNNTMWVSSDKTNWTSVMSILSEVETSKGKRVSAYSNHYQYTGDYQEFVVSLSGKYRIELWGGQGGDFTHDTKHGRGGYVAGEIDLNVSDILYVYVGGQGEKGEANKVVAGGYNGGANGTYTTSWSGGGGGGATDIRLVNGTWSDATSLNSRIMVAGGGGGCGSAMPGYAGGLVGNIAQPTHSSSPGNQFGGYSFGAGQKFTSTYHIGGGGGGYYGGGTKELNGGSGSGGSSYISGHTGCVAIANSTLSNNPRTARNDSTNSILCSSSSSAGYNAAGYNIDSICSVHYSEMTFSNTLMIDGGGNKWEVIDGVLSTTPKQMPSPTGGYYAIDEGHSGYGYARITYLGTD